MIKIYDIFKVRFGSRKESFSYDIILKEVSKGYKLKKGSYLATISTGHLAKVGKSMKN
ncbi:MAG: hypothetical protein ACK5HR_07465 [Mycoplasmatales bacterium]